MIQQTISLYTQGRRLYEITDQVQDIVHHSSIQTGIAHVFCQHTSASLIITENCDSDVQYDIEQYLRRLVIDGDHHFRHTQEGDDDMSGHIRTLLTGSSEIIPISDHRLALGTWQGVYLYEHRYQPHQRHIVVTCMG